MIQVRALGACEIQLGRKRITLTTEVPFALAFYLAQRAGETVTRDELAEAFWGVADPSKARHSLRQTLYKLRLKGFPLDEGAEEIALDRALVESDVARVLAPSWAAAASESEVTTAADFLPGFTRTMAPGFMEWLDGLRAQVAAAHRRGALAHIARARREARWPDLERWAQQVLRTDPLNEEATLARAESAAMAGSKAVALEILDEYMAELGEHAPKIGLPASVLRRRIAERQDEWGSRARQELPLIGRADLMSRLTAFVDDAGRGSGGAVILWGAPGVGKTRLAMEVADLASLRGFRCVTTRANISDRSRPLSGILTLVPLLRDLPGAAGAHPTSLAVLDRVQRQQRPTSPDEPTPSPLAPRADLLAAMADLLEAVCGENRVAVILDDLHHVDDLTHESIERLALSTRHLRLLWIATSRPSEFESSATNSAREGFRRVKVPPLDLESSLALARGTSADVARPLEEGVIRQLAQAAGGNPLFLRELRLQWLTSRDASSVPASIFELIDSKLDALDGSQLYTLRVIAHLGGLANVSRLQRLHTVGPHELASTLGALEEDGVLYLTAGRTVAMHECWQQVLLERTPALVRATLAAEIAQALLADEGDSKTIETRWRAAELLLDAGQAGAAQQLFCDVGDQFYERGLVAESELAFRRAQLTPGGVLSPLLLASRHVRALEALERQDDLDRECDAALRAFVPRSEDDLVAVATIRAVQLEGRVRSKRDHRAALSSVCEIAQNKSYPAAARLLVSFSGLIVTVNDRSTDLEDQFYIASQEATAASAEKPVLALLISLIYATEAGDLALLATSEAALSAREHVRQPDSFACRMLRIRATAQRWSGQLGVAVSLGTRAYEFARQTGLPTDAAMACEILTFAALDSGQLDHADHWMRHWNTARPPSWSAERDHALTHAKARRLLCDEDYQGALDCYRGESAPEAWHLMERRRAADLAVTAVALAGLGQHRECTEALDQCERIGNENRPTPNFDFVVDACAWAADLLGLQARVEPFVSSYLARRAAATPFPIAAGHRYLTARAS